MCRACQEVGSFLVILLHLEIRLYKRLEQLIPFVPNLWRAAIWHGRLAQERAQRYATHRFQHDPGGFETNLFVECLEVGALDYEEVLSLVLADEVVRDAHRSPIVPNVDVGLLPSGDPFVGFDSQNRARNTRSEITTSTDKLFIC